MAAATTEINLVYGQWTNVAPLNERCLVTPQNVAKCKLLVRFQTADPGAGELVGHEVVRENTYKNFNVGADFSAAVWMRPLYPAQDIIVSVTRF